MSTQCFLCIPPCEGYKRDSEKKPILEEIENVNNTTEEVKCASSNRQHERAVCLQCQARVTREVEADIYTGWKWSGNEKHRGGL